MTFIRATNTGKGFITHDDRLVFTLNRVGPDLYEVSGEYQAWVTRVGGVVVPTAEAEGIIGNIAVRRQIADIESKQARAVREAALGDSTYLAQIEAQIAALRAQLV